MMLKIANVYYGSNRYPVKPDSTLPLPAEFDFNQPEQCARTIFAIMSNAAGGHPLRGCKLWIHHERRTANLTADGVHVYYAPEQNQPMTAQQAIQVEGERHFMSLGTVTTSQYGDGWKHACWTDFEVKP